MRFFQEVWRVKPDNTTARDRYKTVRVPDQDIPGQTRPLTKQQSAESDCQTGTPTWGQPRQRRSWGRRPEPGELVTTWRTLRCPSSLERTGSCSVREPGREKPTRQFWTGWAARGCWLGCLTASPWLTSDRRPRLTRWLPQVDLQPRLSPARTFSGVGYQDLDNELIPEIIFRYIGGGGRYKVSCQNLIDKYSLRSEVISKPREYSKSCSNLLDLDWGSSPASQSSTGMRRTKSYSRITEEKSCYEQVETLSHNIGNLSGIVFIPEERKLSLDNKKYLHEYQRFLLSNCLSFIFLWQNCQGLKYYFIRSQYRTSVFLCYTGLQSE